MHTEYVDETSEDVLLYEPVQRTSDIQLPPVMNYLLFGAWGVICLIGFAVMILGKMPLAGGIIIGVPTFCLMIVKPTFALCVMMLGLPTGAGIAAGGMFSLDRGVAVAVTVSFMFNLMLSRPSLHIHNKALWIFIAFAIWTFLISFTSPYLLWELATSLTVIQLAVFSCIVYWIIETNNISTFVWTLRSFVAGSLGVIMITYITGAATQFIKAGHASGGRYSATLGEGIDANFLAVLIGLAFLSAIYLMVSDRNFLFRIIYAVAIVFLPIMLFRTGSRGALVSMFITLTSPFLFIKQVLRKPALMGFLLMVIIVGSTAMWFVATHSTLEAKLTSHLTESENIEGAFSYRIELMRLAVESVMTKPMGATFFGWMSNHDHVPHSDFFYDLGIYGIPGAGLFACFLIVMMFTVKRLPLGFEKFFSRAIVTFLFVSGLSLGQLNAKHYWIFMVIAMTCERVARFKSQAHEITESDIDEEAAGINS